MNGNDIIQLGYPHGELIGSAKLAAAVALSDNHDPEKVKKDLVTVLHNPSGFLTDPIYGELAQNIKSYDDEDRRQKELFSNCHEKTWKVWGSDGIDDAAKTQMSYAMTIPHAIRGALMPDAHVGYGIPIGGVVATKNAVVPFFVGVDIACRMKLSILDTPVEDLKDKTIAEQFKRAINLGTKFGVGASYPKHNRQYHQVMDDNRWNEVPFLNNLKPLAWEQLGTSGSGNHFAEFGILTMDRPNNGTGQGVGQYVALLSHSGSRGTGAKVCDHYSKIAKQKLPKELQEQFARLAWLDMKSEAGQEYWTAMNLMGDYAAANHDVLHKNVAKYLGAQIIGGVENHHNFAWEEEHFGEKVFVHRKGATPADEGEFGIIPGSMGSPAFLVCGKGNPESLKSASHGAGRAMSRAQAKKIFNLDKVRIELAKKDIEIISAGDDEVPGVYKDIEEVMKQQTDLVDKVGRFDPRIVKMSGDGSRAED